MLSMKLNTRSQSVGVGMDPLMNFRLKYQVQRRVGRKRLRAVQYPRTRLQKLGKIVRKLRWELRTAHSHAPP